MAMAASYASASTLSSKNNSRMTAWVRSYDPSVMMPRFIVTLTSYMTVGTIALFTVTSLFCFFFALSVLEDLIRAAIPTRLWQQDWTVAVDKVRLHLTTLAEWERRNKDTWPFRYQDTDRFHDMLCALTDYLKNYVQQHKAQTATTTNKTHNENSSSSNHHHE
ncbi:hypothetical protein BX666DRAFT_1875126 [Dichotomocladium elegans]|nr:hypothetical protein BX666DRAFT_1875126 [Dichotomocladium elegans]